MSTPRIDWDVAMQAIEVLKMSTEGHLVCWNGPFSVLMHMVQIFQQTKLEKALENLGWLVTIQFLEFGQPVKGRIIIVPNPDAHSINQKFLVIFMHAAFVVLGLPRGVIETEETVLTRIKVWGYPVFVGWLPKTLKVQSLLDAWNCAGKMIGETPNMRAVAFSSTMNPDFELGAYAKKDEQDKFKVTVHFVRGLHGGAGNAHFDQGSFIKQKNAIASFLLAQGCDLNVVSAFADRIVKASSPAAVEAVMNPRNPKEKYEAICKLAKTLNIAVPDVSTPVHRRRDKLKNAFKGSEKDVSAAIDLSCITIKEGFFLNEDGSACMQRPDIRPQTTGVCLLDPVRANQWLAHKAEISQDELAVIVVGRCDCQSRSPGKKLQFPAFHNAGEPLVLAGCIHNLGKKQVTTVKATSNIATLQSVVISLTVCRDEVSDETWDGIVRSPVKATLQLCSEELAFLAPPWGRVFQRHRTKVPGSDATSLQFHGRISSDDLTKALQLSGSHAVYVTAKDENKKISDDFQIVWLPALSLVDLQVTASSYPHHRGIVRSMKGGDTKIVRGLRFRRADFKTAFSELRPNDVVPSDIPPTCLFKISPVPVGASSENIQSWLDGLSWKAKPMRLLASNVWLCAAASVYDSTFEMWDDRPILVKWIASRSTNNQVVVAGDSTKIRPTHKSAIADTKDVSEDPWAAYNLKKSGPSSASTPAGAIPAAAVRKLEAPIEERFKKQNVEWDQFREQQKKFLEEIRSETSKDVQLLQKDISQLKDTVLAQSQSFERQNQANAAEFGAVRQETKEQFAMLTASLQDSLKQSLQKQDHTIASQFQEIKTLLQNKENPPKKLKGERSEEMDP